MKISDKVKTALNEIRTLTLGAQILLGFQFRGVFSDRYSQLSAQQRSLNALALGFMVCVIGLLISPGPYHRIVEGGDDSGRFHSLATAVISIALLPFALALGIDLFLAVGVAFDLLPGTGAAVIGTALALWFWYGFPRFRSRHTGGQERSMTKYETEERSATPLHAKIDQMLTEGRVVLPGAQALFGFQLSIVLTTSFQQLPTVSKTAHAVSLLLVALAIVLLMAPAAYHRIVFAGEDAPDMYRVGSAFMTFATVPLALGMAGDIYVVMTKISGPPAFGIGASAAALMILTGLWHAYPFAIASMRRRRIPLK